MMEYCQYVCHRAPSPQNGRWSVMDWDAEKCMKEGRKERGDGLWMDGGECEGKYDDIDRRRRATRESAKNCIAAERAADGSVAGETRERMTSSRWNVKIVFGPSFSLFLSPYTVGGTRCTFNPET